jgi:TRAP-type C4-dicarboxylate transport system substrate-binding protein
MSEVGVKGLAFSENGMRFLLNNTRDIVTPDDLAGLKLRVMQNDLYMAFYNNTKASAVPLAWGEVYTAVTQGTIDGFDLPCPSILSYKFQEVIEHISEFRYTYTSLMTMMNQNRFDALTAEQQGWVMEAAATASQAAYENNDMLLERMFDVMDEAGVSVTRYADMDVDAFRAIGESTWDEMIQSEEGQAILTRVKEARGIS